MALLAVTGELIRGVRWGELADAARAERWRPDAVALRACIASMLD